MRSVYGFDACDSGMISPLLPSPSTHHIFWTPLARLLRHPHTLFTYCFDQRSKGTGNDGMLCQFKSNYQVRYMVKETRLFRGDHQSEDSSLPDYHSRASKTLLTPLILILDSRQKASTDPIVLRGFRLHLEKYKWLVWERKSSARQAVSQQNVRPLTLPSPLQQSTSISCPLFSQR